MEVALTDNPTWSGSLIVLLEHRVGILLIAYRHVYKGGHIGGNLRYCENCHNLANVLHGVERNALRTDSSQEEHLWIGRRSLLNDKRGYCHGCDFILKTLEKRLANSVKYVREKYDNDLVFSAKACSRWPRLTLVFGCDLRCSLKARHSNVLEHMFFWFQSDNALEREGNSCRIPRIRPDLEIVRRWISFCEKHGGRCQTVSGAWLLPFVREISFIDVVELCIVSFPEVPRSYFILSYVWGDNPTLVRLQSNADAMSRPGSLRDAFEVPPTIKDAMTVTQALGERYLWVDALCIVQDDWAAKPPLLNAMAALYAKARLTIVAADGTSVFAGLSGVSRISDRAEEIFCLPGIALLYTNEPSASYHQLSKVHWSSRAWCFQEHVFSRRLLVFDRFLSWRCSRSTCFELQYEEKYQAEEDYKVQNISERPKLFVSGWPSLDEYGSLIELFNERDIRNPHEVPDAFAGALSTLAQAFPGGFLHGLPEYYFDLALLWQPHRSGSPRARSASDQEALPSWSWFAHKGALRLDLWYRSADYLDSFNDDPFPVRISPMVNWIEKFQDGSSRPVDNSYRQVRASSSKPGASSKKLPDGWVRHFDRETKQLYYQNPFIGPTRFRYIEPPFVRPRDIDDQYRPELPKELPRSPWPRLASTAERTYVTLGAFKRREFRGREYVPHDVNILSASNEWIGEIRILLHRDEHSSVRRHCEIIGISHGECPLNAKAHQAHPFAELRDPDGLVRTVERDGNGQYHFVNIFWICWSNGLAYRKALGRIWERRWLEMERQAIDLTFG